MTLNASSLSTVRLRDARELRVLGHGDGEPVAVVDVQHHVHVRAAVADVDRPVGRRCRAAPRAPRRPRPCRSRPARARSIALRRCRVVLELGAEDVLGRDDACERRLNHLARRRRDDEEREPMPVDARARGNRPAPGCCCAAGPAGPSRRGARGARRGTPDRAESGRPARRPAARDCSAPARPPSPGNREAPISSLRTSPESLKLSVWSKSDATRKCFGIAMSIASILSTRQLIYQLTAMLA